VEAFASSAMLPGHKLVAEQRHQLVIHATAHTQHSGQQLSSNASAFQHMQHVKQ
jgi:hypothetical protein